MQINLHIFMLGTDLGINHVIINKIAKHVINANRVSYHCNFTEGGWYLLIHSFFFLINMNSSN